MNDVPMNVPDPRGEQAALALRPDLPLGMPYGPPPPPGERYDDDDTIDLRQYWEIIRKRKWTPSSTARTSNERSGRRCWA
ncbi:MAG: hypothetical protein K0B16_11905 [Burkholderiaceae bacterium]|nr:hypothetical protein [Burkholderiaceae bacterium]